MYIYIYIHSSIIKIFRLRPYIGPPAFFLLGNLHFWICWTCTFLKKTILKFGVFFSKMTPQAKPPCPYESYRNSVQNPGLRDFSPVPNHRKPSIIVSWPECQPEIPNDAHDGDDSAQTMFPSGQTPSQ